jgi:AsmA family protein
MAKAAKIIGIVLAALVMLLIGAAMLVQTQWAQEKLEDQLSQRLDGRDVEIANLDIDWGLPLGIRAEGIKVANPDWAEQPYMLELDALQVKLDVGALLTGNLSLQLLALDQPDINLARRADGQSNWAALTGNDKPDNGSSPIQPETIRIQDGQLTYRDEALDAEVTLDIETSSDDGKRRLKIDGKGNIQGKPLALLLTGEPPAEALDSDSPYAVKLEASLGEIRATFDGEAAELPALDELHGQLSMSAPASAELMSFDNPAIDIPGFELDAKLQRDGDRWALQDIDLQSGESSLNGSLVFAQGSTPELDLTLHGDRLDLNRWGVMRLLQADRNKPDSGADEQQSVQQRVNNMVQPLRRYRGEIDVSLDRLLYGDAALSEVALKGALADGQLEIERLHAAQGEGALTASGGFDLRQDSLSGTLDATFDTLDLGRALAPFGYPQLGTLDGELHGRLAQDSARLGESHLRYDAPAQDFWVEVDADSTDSGLTLQGSAERNQVPLSFEADIGPLQQLFADEPFPIKATVTSRETRLEVDGTVTDPFDLQAANAQVSLEGPNPARLNPLTGLDLPSLAPYQLSGQLSWKEQQLRLQDLRANWGESDLSGDIRLSLSGRPMLWANLHSDTLVTDDLKAPGTPTDPKDDQMFSDEALGLDALRNRDAIVRYEADNVNANDIPLNAVDLKAELDNGLLVVEPLQLAVGKGKAEGRLRLDVRPEQRTGELHLSISSVNLTPLLREADFPQVAQDSTGTIGGRLDLDFAGSSLGAMAADLDGKLELAMSGGKLDMLAVEVLGLDAGEAAVGALADSDQVDMNCTYLRLDSTEGTAKLEQFFISTSDSNITGGGNIELESERLDLAFEAHAKDISLFSGNSPVQLKGTLSNPQVSVVTGELAARAAASLVGAIVAPPLAILPWVEAGLGEDSGIGCRKALNEFEQGSGN